jgi:L-ascorbate metabolism protein UlaG (beta-lactamase superfamily)
MKRLVTILLAGLLAAVCGGAGESQQHEDATESRLDLLFVANEGVLVRTAAHKVLIDALFTDPPPDYAAPPAEMLQQMEGGRAPFDDINLVLVTHNHADHFDPALAARFLGSNPQAQMIAPEDAATALRDSSEQWASIADRVIPIALSPGERSQRTVAGITLTAYRTLHSGDRETPQNLMYLIEIDGHTVFHEGDSDGKPETFTGFGLGGKHIDLALVHFWFPLDADGEGILLGILKPDHVGLFHLPEQLRSDAPTTIGQVAANYGDIFLLMDPGESRTFLP